MMPWCCHTSPGKPISRLILSETEKPLYYLSHVFPNCSKEPGVIPETEYGTKNEGAQTLTPELSWAISALACEG